MIYDIALDDGRRVKNISQEVIDNENKQTLIDGNLMNGDIVLVFNSKKNKWEEGTIKFRFDDGLYLVNLHNKNNEKLYVNENNIKFLNHGLTDERNMHRINERILYYKNYNYENGTVMSIYTKDNTYDIVLDDGSRYYSISYSEIYNNENQTPCYNDIYQIGDSVEAFNRDENKTYTGVIDYKYANNNYRVSTKDRIFFMCTRDMLKFASK